MKIKDIIIDGSGKNNFGWLATKKWIPMPRLFRETMTQYKLRRQLKDTKIRTWWRFWASPFDKKKFTDDLDLMHQINGRGTYMVSKFCLPHLKKSDNPHILNLAPPLDMEAKWFAGTVAYTMAKYTMSMCVLGMAEEFKDMGIAVNALWPRTAIATAAVQNHLGGDEIMKLSRTVEIMADASYEILTKDSKEFTGNFCIDDIVLYESGVKDFTKYASVPFGELMPDFFVPDSTPLPDEIKNS